MVFANMFSLRERRREQTCNKAWGITLLACRAAAILIANHKLRTGTSFLTYRFVSQGEPG